jgi:hypothetical protein
MTILCDPAVDPAVAALHSGAAKVDTRTAMTAPIAASGTHLPNPRFTTSASWMDMVYLPALVEEGDARCRPFGTPPARGAGVPWRAKSALLPGDVIAYV